MNRLKITKSQRGLASIFFAVLVVILLPNANATVDISNVPLFLGGSGTPLSLLVMGRDHKLYYEAYNDASDLNQDGEINVGYKPNLTQDGKPLNYFGYFDSYKCYSYSSGVFSPISVATNKKCSNAWSGDFLNYLTTSRIDALRRVLYGGWRSTDTSTETILERSHIPQDAHSWGKEYQSIARDGFDIREYTPLSLPAPGTRHLFANTTLRLDTSQLPLLRVLTNSPYRIWNWVSIERPVAGDQCVSGITTGGAEVRTNCESTGGTDSSHPGNHQEFNALLERFGSQILGSGPPANGRIQCDSNCNPFSTSYVHGHGYYITVFDGNLQVATGGTYEFSVDGDDAIEVIINGQVVTGWYGGHGKCGTSLSCRDSYKGSINLSAGSHKIVFRHEEVTGDDNYYLYWKGPDSLDAWQIVPSTKFTNLTVSSYGRIIPTSVRTDYTVRVKACVNNLLEPECKGYPANNPTVYKPTGLLHEYGETDRMAFGLLTGSFKKHMSGGLLRKNVASFKNEINPSTGQFVMPSTGGSIVGTIDKIRVVGFRGNATSGSGAYFYSDNGCAVPMVTPMQEGRCAMWGNPIAEMMYEGLRYFGGKTGPTSAYAVSGDEFSGFNAADNLNLPKPAWSDPYKSTEDGGGGFPYCSKPFQIVIADIPSFDTDQLPGTAFGSGISSDIGNLNVAAIGQLIWDNEVISGTGKGGTHNIFIGQSGSLYDTAPTPKSANSFGNIRGLSPEEPTREGGYYAASVAYFGKTSGVRQIATDKGPYTVRTDTFGVALSSPLPTIEIPVPSYNAADKKFITIVPFAKSVGGSGINATKGQFQPTNTIVDFYVETIANTGPGNEDLTINAGRPYIKFRINYEDSEYGSDHDMDAIVTYTFSVNESNQLVVNLSSDYAAGGVIHHMGYVISGTTADGVYLEVRDTDTATGSDPDYFLDTPPTFVGIPPAPQCATPGPGCWNDGVALPLQATRTFTPGTATASLIKNLPLWYAAKWGGFIDTNDNKIPDLQGEWDRDGDGKPDSFFLVTNAGKLKEQLSQTFEEIIKRTSSASAVAVNSGTLIANSKIYQARFNSGDWTGELRAVSVNPQTGAIEANPVTGEPLEAWTAQAKLRDQDFNTGRHILTRKPSNGDGIPFRWPNSIPSDPAVETGATALDQAQIAALNGSDGQGQARLNYLRGDDSNEDPQGNQYRKRGTGLTRNILGDIVNSNPFYVGPPSAGYGFGGYQNFVDTHKSRRPMIYVGANDGMMHGFDANTGEEVFAFVPSAVFNNLNALTELTYEQQHQYYVNGSPTAVDVQFSNNSWHTVLVSGLGAGGTSVFALDVTDAGNVDGNGNVTGSGLTEANANSIVLWEFTHADLGLTFSQPSLVRLSNNTWAAIFGNGYNNTGSGNAALFVVNVEDGALIRKIDLPEGLGLSTPRVIDGNDDKIADFVYAGDLQGNLWRFDLRPLAPADWTVARLFTAKDANGLVQPITSAPDVTLHPSRNPSTVTGTQLDELTYMVVFGTGRYLGNTDVTNTDRQTFYGIWDDVDGDSCPAGSVTACFARADLQEQIYCPGSPVDPTCQVEADDGSLIASAGQFTSDGRTFRVTSARCVEYGSTETTKQCGDPSGSQKRGWYLDLKLAGERVVGDSLILGNRVIFTSILPDRDPCRFGGSSWLNVLNAVSGQRVSASFLGTGENSNTPVTESNTGFAPTSLAIEGIASPPSVIRSPEQKKAILPLSTSETGGGSLSLPSISDSGIGRLTWRQLEF